MAFTLYDATIPSYLQILGSVERLVGKAETFCKDNDLDPDDLIQARLADDMLPFAYQVKSVAVHSWGAIEGVRSGTFSPDTTTPPATFVALRERVADTISKLQGIDPDEVEGSSAATCASSSARAAWSSSPRTSCCRSPNPISIFMQPPPTTSCA